ncbi:MAG TPA: pyridoxal-phosphate dependent enzyme [Bacteriovoracaceae bacterium]|nr:pyridoxal-phosphate dependent enzyme [Bacteriovoracaceae bacterium]
MQSLAEVHCLSKDYSPAPVISKFRIEEKTIFAVRDDLLIAGTKQRAAIPYLRKLMAQGFRHFVYASPFSGFAQVALAYACQELGAKCILFCESDNENKKHEFTALAESFGAEIYLTSTLEGAHRASVELVFSDGGLKLIPLGFNTPDFTDCLEVEISRHWSKLEKGFEIRELWLPIGSGTLLGVFKKIVGKNVRIIGVNVNVLPETDVRISRIRENPEISYHKSSQKFHEPCRELPPVPSNLYYDSKAFVFLRDFASDGAFWWNVAR